MRCREASALASARELLGCEGRLNRLIADQTLREQLVDIPVIRVDSHVELERLDDRLTGIDGTGVDEFFLLFLRYGGANRLIGDAQRATRAKRRAAHALVRQTAEHTLTHVLEFCLADGRAGEDGLDKLVGCPLTARLLNVGRPRPLRRGRGLLAAAGRGDDDKSGSEQTNARPYGVRAFSVGRSHDVLPRTASTMGAYFQNNEEWAPSLA